MKSLFLLPGLLVVLYANAQKQAIIKGTITGLEDGSKIYLVPNSSDTWRDSAVIKKHKFYFKLNISEGNSYSLRLSREYQMGKWKDFYIDEGVFIIQGKNGAFNNCRISGSQYAKEFNDYNNLLEIEKIYENFDDITKQGQDAEKRNDTILAYKLYNEFQKIDSLKTILAKKWVAAHPGSPVSSYVLYMDIRQHVSPEDLEMLLEELSPKAKNNSLARKLQNSIDARKATAIGKIAPDFIQADTSGNSISLKNFRGKYVLIDFWASWCIPCREENPNLVALFKKYNQKGFTVIGVSLDRDKDKWIDAIQKDYLPWTHISDLRFWDNEVAKKYGIKSVPFNLLLDYNGKIIAKNLHGEELERKLFEIIK